MPSCVIFSQHGQGFGETLCWLVALHPAISSVNAVAAIIFFMKFPFVE